MRVPILFVLLLLGALFLPLADAYGTLDPANRVGAAAQPATHEALRFVVYGFYASPMPAEAWFKIGYEDDAGSWYLYQDANSNNRHDDGELRTDGVPVPPVLVHGNLTDHVLLQTAAGVTVSLCLDAAGDGLADGFARGLRCNGDLDRDGAGDFSEVAEGRNPIARDTPLT